jgi:hypothetical protein
MLNREPLSPEVVAMAFNREAAASEARELQMEIVKSDIPRYGHGNAYGIPVVNPPDTLVSENMNTVRLARKCAVFLLRAPRCLPFLTEFLHPG